MSIALAAASSTTASTTANPLDALNSFSTSNPLSPLNPNNPLNQMGNMLSDLSSNLTDAVNDGLGDAINGITEQVVDQAGVENFYYLYLQKICSAALAGPDESNADGVKIGECRSREDAERSKKNLTNTYLSPVRSGRSIHTSPRRGGMTISQESKRNQKSEAGQVEHLVKVSVSSSFRGCPYP